MIGLVVLLWFAGCLLAIGYGLFAFRAIENEVVRPTILRLTLASIVNFFAVWLFLATVLPVLAWIFWLGDRNHLFLRAQHRV